MRWSRRSSRADGGAAAGGTSMTWPSGILSAGRRSAGPGRPASFGARKEQRRNAPALVPALGCRGSAHGVAAGPTQGRRHKPPIAPHRPRLHVTSGRATAWPPVLRAAHRVWPGLGPGAEIPLLELFEPRRCSLGRRDALACRSSGRGGWAWRSRGPTSSMSMSTSCSTTCPTSPPPLREMRSHRPALWARAFGEPALLLLSHELVNAAFRDEDTFPSAEFYGRGHRCPRPQPAVHVRRRAPT